MLFHDVIFAAVFFAFYSSGKAHTQNWVKQWPSEVYRTPGENITMHCQTHGDIQKAKCLVNWYIKNKHGKYVSINKLTQFSGRHSEDKKENHERQTFTLKYLELSDTGRFYCNYLCRISGMHEQYYGPGTQLFVHFMTENVTQGSPLCTSNKTDEIEAVLTLLTIHTLQSVWPQILVVYNCGPNFIFVHHGLFHLFHHHAPLLLLFLLFLEQAAALVHLLGQVPPCSEIVLVLHGQALYIHVWQHSQSWAAPVRSHVEGKGKNRQDSNGLVGKFKRMKCSVSVGNNGVCRSVAPVTSPESACARISLPGVMDAEGRVDESRLRMHIFKNGGVSPDERGLAWRFLFGMYPCSSTALERPLLMEQMAVRYQVMKRKWQRLLPGAVCLRLNGTDAELLKAVKFFDQRQDRELNKQQNESEEDREMMSFLQLQAQVLFERVNFDLEELQEAIRIIDKDVPRTDRYLPYYRNEGLGNLLVLRDILITYAAFHPEVSYAQGMNDLCSRFLEVLDSEVDTYWSFSCYMEKFSKDFQADGLYRKMELEAALLKELDPQLHTHLVTENMEKITFCHRWLLLGFQREFEHSDALRLFEILSCDHLELISEQVDRARYRERLARRCSL
ncbi:hypothetical protein QQF64_008924, partial [Cirrhinus molitorella]